MDKEATQNEPNIPQNMDLDPPRTTGETLTGGHIPFAELRLTPFTPSKHHTMDCLGTIIFYMTRKAIIRSSEKILKMGTHTIVVTITENTIMEGTHKDSKFTASVKIAAAQASADNVDRLMNDMEQNKEKMMKLKDNLVKMQGEGIELKRKHDAILSENEILLDENQNLETKKDALTM